MAMKLLGSSLVSRPMQTPCSAPDNRTSLFSHLSSRHSFCPDAIPTMHISQKQTTTSADRLTVSAKIRKTKRAPMDPDYPWPEKYKAEEEGFLAFLSRKFRENTKEKSKPMVLPFERPLVDLENKIEEVRTRVRFSRLGLHLLNDFLLPKPSRDERKIL